MKILDLFAGLGGEQRREEIESRGHSYTTLDFDPSFGCDITADVFEWEPTEDYDFVWASPPCPGFSVAAIYRHWDNYMPISKTSIDGIRLVLRTMEIIRSIDPSAWIVENPRGMLRNLPLMNKYRRWTVTYCQYGDNVMKPTDLWGVVPGWIPRPMCKNGDTCHESAVKGADKGTQSQNRNPAKRAIVPLELWLEILDPTTAKVTAPLLPLFI